MLYGKKLGSGTNVICLHGLFGSSSNLGFLTRYLSNLYLVYNIDVRNHGLSFHKDTMTYKEMAQDVIEYMDANQINQAHLIGHSMGGKIAMELALHYTERFLKVVVLDIAPVTYKKRRHDNIFNAIEAVPITKINKRMEADNIMSIYIPEYDIRQFILKSLSQHKNDHFFWRFNIQALKKNYHLISLGQDSHKPFLNQVLFLKGDHSDYILPSHRDVVLKLFPKASMKIINNTNHWLHAQKPEIIANLIVKFLDQKFS